jgi:hypothetical protein
MNRTSLRRVMSWTLLALVMTACTRQPQPARIEEITFQSGEFKLVGDSVGPAPTLMRSTFPILGDDRSPIRPLRCLR